MTLRWYRSWPAPHEYAERGLATRPQIVDGLPRLLMTDHNYRHVEWPTDEPGFCLLEWDVALDPLAMRAFAATALVEPREVLVAPYRFWDTWCMWIGNDGSGPSETSRPVQPSDTHCDSFGLGCVYLPTDAVRRFVAEGMIHDGFTDATFGRWYRARYGQARLCWDVHPQHLHDYEVT